MRNIEFEKQLLEADIQRYSQVPDAQNNPSLSPKDAMMIREIEDPKSARLYLTNVYEENRRNAIEDAQRNVKDNAMAQQQSLQQAAVNDQALQKEKLTNEKEMLDYKMTKEKELESTRGLWAAIAKGIVPSDIAMPIIQQLVPNISMNLAVDNKDDQDAVIAVEHEKLARQFADQQMPQEEGAEQMQGQPQMQPM